ncbi:MAG TPA: nucleotidyltransferase domain-containing protein [Symbiobacteriaceae bacterium]|nr:nucleotidyltransferase domain-containing protein [Symbiobacteriaceae bacterium]
MPWRFQSALDMALDELQSAAGVEGILFFGSAMAGTAGPTSDLDLYVVTESGPRISLRRYAGVEAEVHYAPREFWQSRMEKGNAVILHAFATGQALLDRTGNVAELAGFARRKVEEGPPALTSLEIDRWRYRLTDLAGDLEDVAGQPADEHLVGGLLVQQCLEAYCALNRLWGDKPKRLLAYVERHEPELGRMARTFFAGGMDRHLAQTLVDRVLAPHGGRIGVWDSQPENGLGHA